MVPGSLKQIDVGNGQVFGVNSNNQSYTLYNGDWIQVPGSLMHISVGPAGVWGVDPNYYIYKLVGGDWVIVGGEMVFAYRILRCINCSMWGCCGIGKTQFCPSSSDSTSSSPGFVSKVC